MRGAAKDVAEADLNRQRASQIAGLTTGVQPLAAQALAGMGGQQVSQGVGAASAGAGALGQVGGLYGGLLQSGAQNRMYGREQGAQAGQSMGGFLFDIINGLGGRRAGGGNTGISGLGGNSGYAGPIYGPGY